MGLDKQKIMKDFKVTGDNDTGSPGVQISILSAKIARLTEHLKINKKDNHSRYGLLQMVNSRRKLLDYLRSKDFDMYKKVITALGIRR